jgi:8-oxo-dGTP diphosphatase
MSSHALVLLVRDGRLLLARKRRGLGTGLLVAPGGKVEPGESAVEAAVRELAEETGLVAGTDQLEEAGRIRFLFAGSDRPMDVALFRASAVPGEPVATEELADPRWYAIDALPLADMWLDNAHWLPGLLAGGRVAMSVEYDADATRILSISG